MGRAPHKPTVYVVNHGLLDSTPGILEGNYIFKKKLFFGFGLISPPPKSLVYWGLLNFLFSFFSFLFTPFLSFLLILLFFYTF